MNLNHSIEQEIKELKGIISFKQGCQVITPELKVDGGTEEEIKLSLRPFPIK